MLSQTAAQPDIIVPRLAISPVVRSSSRPVVHFVEQQLDRYRPWPVLLGRKSGAISISSRMLP